MRPDWLECPVHGAYPDLVGPIEDIQEVPENDLANDLVVGDQTILITPDVPRPLGGGGLIRNGLFLYGDEGDESWYLVLARATTGPLAGCYTLSSGHVFDDGRISSSSQALTRASGCRREQLSSSQRPFPTPANMHSLGTTTASRRMAPCRIRNCPNRPPTDSSSDGRCIGGPLVVAPGERSNLQPAANSQPQIESLPCPGAVKRSH